MPIEFVLRFGCYSTACERELYNILDVNAASSTQKPTAVVRYKYLLSTNLFQVWSVRRCLNLEIKEETANMLLDEWLTTFIIFQSHCLHSASFVRLINNKTYQKIDFDPVSVSLIRSCRIYLLRSALDSWKTKFYGEKFIDLWDFFN